MRRRSKLGNLLFIGRQHFINLTFCECEPQAASMVRYGFWPASPIRPNVGFSLPLLRLMTMLTLECAVSVAGFVQTLRWINNLSSKEVSPQLCYCVARDIPKTVDMIEEFQKSIFC
jgi:hypothetical protein